jgi:hypothetical protein
VSEPSPGDFRIAVGLLTQLAMAGQLYYFRT